jgi:hypothetical protein
MLLSSLLSCSGPALAGDDLYSVQLDGKDIGTTWITVTDTDLGQRVSELSELLLPSFWGDTSIHAFKQEDYNTAFTLNQAKYLTLYNQYLMLVDITPAHRNLLNYRLSWFELNDRQQAQVKKAWKELSDQKAIAMTLESWLVPRLSGVKAEEQYSEFIDPTEFDMTLTAFNLRLPQLLTSEQSRSFILLDPESEAEQPYYHVTARAVTDSEARSTDKRSTEADLAASHPGETALGLHKIAVDYQQGGQSLYQFERTERGSRLVKLLDQSGEESIVLTLRSF